MKILKHGNPKKINPQYTGACTRCGCEVLCEYNEVIGFTDSRNESYYHVLCPECGTSIYLDLVK